MSEIEEGVGEWFDPTPLRQLYINKNLMQHNISRLEDEVSAYSERCSELSDENEKFSCDLADAADEIEVLEETVERLCRHLDDLKEALAHAQAMLRAEKQDHAATVRFFSKLLLDATEGDQI